MLRFTVSPGLQGFRGVENRRLEKIRVPEPGGCENLKYCQTIYKKSLNFTHPQATTGAALGPPWRGGRTRAAPPAAPSSWRRSAAATEEHTTTRHYLK